MARPASKFAQIKNFEQRNELTSMWKAHDCHYTRLRAHAILLSDRRTAICEICETLNVDRNSVSSWIDRFTQGGAEALEDRERSGSPRALNDQEQQILDKLFDQYPNQPSKVLAELKEKTGKEITLRTLREYARRLRRSWKRPRRSLREKRDEHEFRVTRGELENMIQDPDREVAYFDEAGFSLNGVLSYGWYRQGERMELPVGNGRQSVQVLGFESQTSEVHAYMHRGTVNTDMVISVFDDYCHVINKPTTVVLDNAPCHRSHAFTAKASEWARNGLQLYYLPPYSPELNAIERLWKKIKHQILPIAAWKNLKSLISSLTTALNKLGQTSYMDSLACYAE